MGNNKCYLALVLPMVGLAMFVCWMLDPAMFWSICKWSIGGLFAVCMLMGLFDTDSKPYQIDGPGSYYHNSQKKQWKKGGK